MTDSEDKRQQAQYIWNRLDDLAATDPKAYKTFIDQQMKEREIFMSNPKAEMCVSTSAQIGMKEVEVFVNICSWKRMPDVKSETDPVQLMTGNKTKHRLNKSSGEVLCVPVAVNDRFYEEICRNERDKKDFIRLCLELVRRHAKVPVSHTFQIHKEVFVGVFPANPRSLFVNDSSGFSDPFDLLAKGELPADPEKILSSPESLLKNLSLGGEKENSEPIGNEEKKMFDSLLGQSGEKNKGKKLIEEINAEPATPEYIFVESDQMKLKISLPLVCGMSECDLNISKDEIQLEASSKYKLDLKLPKKINEDLASARFNKKTSNLTLTAPYL